MTQTPAASTNPRIFISYARKDGRKAAEDFEALLTSHGLTAWRDLKDMGAGDIWPQVRDAIEGVEHLVLILTRRALASGWVRKEWNHARQSGVQVSPVLADNSIVKADLPRWLSSVEIFDLAEPERQQRLLRDLEGRGSVRRVPYDVPDLPPSLVQRPVQFDKIKHAVMAGSGGGTVGITTSLAGSGGYGKTTLANMLLLDEDVRFHFTDGIVRLDIGKERNNILSLIGDVILRLHPDAQRPAFQNVESAASHLAEMIGEAKLLLVLDDVWREGQLRPFLRGGPNCVRLITTRKTTLPGITNTIPVDQLQEGEARQLLSWGLSAGPAERRQINALAKRLGYWAQMLEIANGWLRERIHQGEGLGAALSAFTKRLEKRGLTAFDADDANARNRAIGLCVDASIEELSGADQARLMELSILPEDTDVPVDTITALWHRTGGLDDLDCDNLLCGLHRLSLLQRLDRGTRSVRLHDNMKWLLRDRLGPEAVRTAHGQMADAIRDAGGGTWATLPTTDSYGWQHGPYHLRAAGRGDEVSATLLDYAWIKAKLEQAGAQALFETYLPEEPDSPAYPVRRALAMSVPTLARWPSQLGVQLCGRLAGLHDPALCHLLDRAAAEPTALSPRWPILSPPGALLLRIDAHRGGVTSVCFSPDNRRILSGGNDGAVRLWDAATGAEIASGQVDRQVNSVCFAPDGRHFFSSHVNGTIRIWDGDDCTELARWSSGHDKTCIAHSPTEARLLSFGRDVGIRIWDTETRQCLLTLPGQEDRVNHACWSPDGQYIASAGQDKTLRLWRASTGEELHCLRGHEEPVRLVCWSPDGRTILSVDSAGTFGMATLAGDFELGPSHGPLLASELTISPKEEHRIAVGLDKCVSIYDTKSWQLLFNLNGHDGEVKSVCWSNDGKIAISCGEDGQICLWRVDTNHSFDGDKNRYTEVFAVRFTVGGEALLASNHIGNNFQFLTANTRKCKDFPLFFLGYNCIAISHLAFFALLVNKNGDLNLISVNNNVCKNKLHLSLPYGNSFSFSLDSKFYSVFDLFGNLSIWETSNPNPNPSKKIEAKITYGYHTWHPNGSYVLIIGNRAATFSLSSGTEIWSVKPKDYSFFSTATYSPTGDHICLGSRGGTILVLDADTGQERTHFPGHDGEVTVIQYTPDGHYLVSGGADRTLRLWCASSYRPLALLSLDASVTALDCHGDAIAVGDRQGKVCVIDINRGMLS